uniref:Uncharacterized protein n=1 Tax=Polytomella parva TaxID=51329 RepID=A0A7S0UPD2_9CHLO|mmetsp:Transcript_11224/g.20324  ORF Transcript_11224/g.20324 Transcript_11224/m.20324 type:complete len:244 (+) Transcript_11224:76-807(+)|eukprot:CAMPEP_0175040050 /NCGR_PEP_ID=MMETSP0052_2-20121109/1013_1 /TAXON_ID=51329 ORGANISM="Polytomella parva, Strain SAG 63-3" /NCGR_SAMPLE_ID=MMETSP0052_2 /ASSEMBLY_ACC=CAM_ASM_000194 /LENGTH=243 /DNA_ID=CAMNT_0016302149 /DNA_START=74 /DNA_END=805 /DNA_ORIENTATION=+
MPTASMEVKLSSNEEVNSLQEKVSPETVVKYLGQEAMGHTPHNFHILSTPPFVLADPGALGLICFGMSACTLSFALMIWVPSSEPGFIFVPLSYALMFGGITELIAGILELIKGNTFGGTVFSAYGSFWMSLFFFNFLSWQYPEIGNAGQAKKGLALFYGLLGLLSAGFLSLACRKNFCLVIIFITLVLAFGLLAGGQYNYNVAKAGGYFVGLAGLEALYTSFASMLKSNGVNLPGIEPIELY